MVKGFQDRGIYIFNSFGSNEGCSLFGTHRELPDPEDRALYFPRWGAEGFEWAYRCAKAVHNKLVDSEGNIITERGVIGELYIKGPGVFPGYYKRPDLNEKSFDKDGWFATGDLFSIEGENLDKYKFQGRSKDIIIRGGFNISAEEIENKIIANPKVAEVAVVGYPDERLGEKVCACVVPVKGETVTLEDIIESLGDVAIYKRPEKLLVLDSLPRNPLNKLLKKDLRVLAAQN